MMPRIPRTFRLLLAGPILIGLAAFSAWSEVFECKDARGNNLYQDSPCPLKPSQRTTVPARTPDSHPNDPQKEAVRMFLLRKMACDLALPGFREESAALFKRWRNARRREVAQVESSVEYRRTLSKTKAMAAQADGRGAQEDKAIRCDDALLAEMEEQVRAVDSRFSSPDRTWQTFLRALEGANRDLAVSCLTSSALSEHEPFLRTQPREKLWKISSEFTVLEFKDDFGPFKIAVAPTPGGGERRIYFERIADGEWKIAKL